MLNISSSNVGIILHTWRLIKFVIFLCVLFLLTFLVKNDTSLIDNQNLSEEIINDNIQDSHANVEKDPILELNLQMKIKKVTKFPSIKPDNCVNTAKLRGILTKETDFLL